jgi:mono/diheme cytochrome c family protein
MTSDKRQHKIKYQTGLILLALILVACGQTAASLPPAPTFTAQQSQGKQIFTRDCSTCHSTSEDTIIVGPSLAGVATRAETRVPGQDGYTYLLTSILNPEDYLVAGFEALMPVTFGRTLTGEELDAVIAYLLTLE